jgi:hypothetical protein
MGLSCEAAQECGPRRTPWGTAGKRQAPTGAGEMFPCSDGRACASPGDQMNGKTTPEIPPQTR